MWNRISNIGLLIPVLVLFGCNGGATDSENGEGGGSGFTAKIDGKNWESGSQSAQVITNASLPGFLSIYGFQSSGSHPMSALNITLYNVSGVGSYDMGVGASVFGGMATFGEGSNSGAQTSAWITPMNGMAGKLEITSLDGGRVVGTFHFTLEPGANNPSTGELSVTEGRFDLPLNGALASLPENIGSMVTAKLNGEPFKAAAVVNVLMNFGGETSLHLSATNNEHGLVFILKDITEPGSYPLSIPAPQRVISAGLPADTAAPCCWGANPGDEGEVVITSITAERVKGAFSATLKPQLGRGNIGDLEITDGAFDIGLPAPVQ